MARNMYVTVLADTKDFTNKMKGAGRTTDAFGRLVKGVGSAGLLAFAGMAVGLANMVPDMIKAGEESAKMDKRLEKMVENTGQFKGQVKSVTERLAEYANTTMLATGADDESIKAIQSKLLMFGSLAAKADAAGGAMDRATLAVVDLAAVGMGSATQAATRLGKLLENPIKNFNVLSKAGIQFTDVQKEHITQLEETNQHWQAQDYILDVIEGKVGGLARSQVSSLDLLKLRFDEMGESIGVALLPAVDAVATAMSDWLDDPATKSMFDSFVDDIEAFADWVASPEGSKVINDFLADAAENAGLMYDSFKQFIEWINSPDGKATIDKLGASIQGVGDAAKWTMEMMNSDGWRFLFGSGFDPNKANKRADELGLPLLPWTTTGTVPDTTTSSTTGTGAKFKTSNVVVNFNAPVDSVSAGREVARVLNDYKRVNGGI